MPYSILRLLAPLPDPEPWAERACAHRDAGELHVRTFARELEQAGLRRRRPRRPPHCLHCATEIAEDAQRLSVRLGNRTGRLCGPQCAIAFFAASVASAPTQAAPAAAEAPPVTRPLVVFFPTAEDTESHLAAPNPPPGHERTRILAALLADEENGVERFLCRHASRDLVPEWDEVETHRPTTAQHGNSRSLNKTGPAMRGRHR